VERHNCACGLLFEQFVRRLAAAVCHAASCEALRSCQCAVAVRGVCINKVASSSYDSSGAVVLLCALPTMVSSDELVKLDGCCLHESAREQCG
jgi:hypothetical protein